MAKKSRKTQLKSLGKRLQGGLTSIKKNMKKSWKP